MRQNDFCGRRLKRDLFREANPMSSVDQIFHDVFGLSPEIKLKLVHELWDDLAANPPDVPVHAWQIEEVQRRKQKLAEDPSAAMSWEEFDRRMRERYGC